MSLRIRPLECRTFGRLPYPPFHSGVGLLATNLGFIHSIAVLECTEGIGENAVDIMRKMVYNRAQTS